MLSDNIRKYRKENNMSQDELAEKIGVSRQSISLWETDQTQPTIDNIIALAKIFNISSDLLLNDAPIEAELQRNASTPESTQTKSAKGFLKLTLSQRIIIIASLALVLVAIATALLLNKCSTDKTDKQTLPVETSETTGETDNSESDEKDSSSAADQTSSPETTEESTTKAPSTAEITVAVAPSTPVTTEKVTVSKPAPSVTVTTAPPPAVTTAAPTFDLFAYCKNFAVKIGTLNGDYSIYQQEATKYGGNPNEYFSISYWADSNMVEFCLHCPLSDTQSENFYLRMRGGYNKSYEYLTSKYYRDTGVSIRSASGTIDPATFYDGYPINCNSYLGSTTGQTEFMEESRVGMCDLIRCLKQFVTVEKMDCSFADFDFKNF